VLQSLTITLALAESADLSDLIRGNLMDLYIVVLDEVRRRDAAETA
jgi:hypothetical protein